ncbi:hypothetical protein FKP32DRAFT_835005 [Trametes sanguinea]|nr:hypothetical protein FKP32DRAFT_835005 [Trametes sanguinea]
MEAILAAFVALQLLPTRTSLSETCSDMLGGCSAFSHTLTSRILRSPVKRGRRPKYSRPTTIPRARPIGCASVNIDCSTPLCPGWLGCVRRLTLISPPIASGLYPQAYPRV